MPRSGRLLATDGETRQVGTPYKYDTREARPGWRYHPPLLPGWVCQVYQTLRYPSTAASSPSIPPPTQPPPGGKQNKSRLKHIRHHWRLLRDTTRSQETTRGQKKRQISFTRVGFLRQIREIRLGNNTRDNEPLGYISEQVFSSTRGAHTQRTTITVVLEISGRDLSIDATLDALALSPLSRQPGWKLVQRHSQRMYQARITNIYVLVHS